MTPFGEALRRLRAERKITQHQMASDIGVSAAYLSALEHGHRGKPSWQLLQKIIGYFNIIWDDAEELTTLAGISEPRVVIDTSGLAPNATKLANELAQKIKMLDTEKIEKLIEIIK